VASQVETSFECPSLLPAVEEEELRMDDLNPSSSEEEPRAQDFALLSPAERMASRLLQARQQGLTGLVLVSSRDDADATPNEELSNNKSREWFTFQGVDHTPDEDFAQCVAKANPKTSVFLDNNNMGESIEFSDLNKESLQNRVDAKSRNQFASPKPELTVSIVNPGLGVSPIQSELAAVRSLQLATTVVNKLKDASPILTPEALETVMQQRRALMKQGITDRTPREAESRSSFQPVSHEQGVNPDSTGMRGLAASSKTGLESALYEINKSFSNEKIWWTSKPLSPIRKAIHSGKRDSDPGTYRAVEPVSFDNQATAKALHAADEQLQKWALISPSRDLAGLSKGSDNTKQSLSPRTGIEHLRRKLPQVFSKAEVPPRLMLFGDDVEQEPATASSKTQANLNGVVDEVSDVPGTHSATSVRARHNGPHADNELIANENDANVGGEETTPPGNSGLVGLLGSLLQPAHEEALLMLNLRQDAQSSNEFSSGDSALIGESNSSSDKETSQTSDEDTSQTSTCQTDESAKDSVDDNCRTILKSESTGRMQTPAIGLLHSTDRLAAQADEGRTNNDIDPATLPTDASNLHVNSSQFHESTTDEDTASELVKTDMSPKCGC
jgi:hypothetical protein